MLVTADDILSSGNDRPDLAAKATPQQRANAVLLAARVSALLAELGYTKRPGISDGLRDVNATYGAPKSAHKEGKAVDFYDRKGELKKKIASDEEYALGFSELLKKHGLRMEHKRWTPSWAHLDTREPHGKIFKP